MHGCAGGGKSKHKLPSKLEENPPHGAENEKSCGNRNEPGANPASPADLRRTDWISERHQRHRRGARAHSVKTTHTVMIVVIIVITSPSGGEFAKLSTFLLTGVKSGSKTPLGFPAATSQARQQQKNGSLLPAAVNRRLCQVTNVVHRRRRR